MRILVLTIMLLAGHCVLGQFEPGQSDTIPQTESKKKAPNDTVKKRHSPQRAVYLSLALPGAGQIYNRKYWKAPIAWGMLGATINFAIVHHRQYREYYNGFMTLREIDLIQRFGLEDFVESVPEDPYNGQFTPQQLITLQNQTLQNRDLMIILAVVSYGLILVDAYVDGHLFEYDISDDLTLRWEPQVNPALIGFRSPTAGLRLSLTFDQKKKQPHEHRHHWIW
ncbi:MAG: DUF5683 domain-containing protein [Cryomorphaceae bacterium]|nr:DUF5683 domain-containing protein [Cryomorphaceae bacterium]